MFRVHVCQHPPPPHLEAQVDAAYEYILCGAVYLAVAVLLKLAHGDVGAVTAAADEARGGDGALVVVSRVHALGALPGGEAQQGGGGWPSSDVRCRGNYMQSKAEVRGMLPAYALFGMQS